MKNIIYNSIVTALLVVGCSSLKTPNHPTGLPLRYHNARYDFTFFLPASWEGYSVSLQRWDGTRYVAATDKSVTEHGPEIVLRHPQWQANYPWQDIPIRVYTRSQWEGAGQGPPAVGAGGVEEEIAHNAKYVFAISSRFNWGEAGGWEETSSIVARNQAANGPRLHPE